jgi:hypothetical protein
MDEPIEERLRKAEAYAIALKMELIRIVVVLHDTGHYECQLCCSMTETTPGTNPHQPTCLLFSTFENDIRLVPR